LHKNKGHPPSVAKPGTYNNMALLSLGRNKNASLQNILTIWCLFCLR